MMLLLIIGHLIADFYLQSSKMAEDKRKKITILLVHSIIYSCIFAIIDFVFLQPITAVWTTIIIAGMHFVIDFTRTKIDRKCKSSKSLNASFFIDQILHFAVILVTYYCLELSEKGNFIYVYCKANSNFEHILTYCLLFLALLNPTSILIKNVLAFLFNEGPNKENGNNAGNVIGMLERTITSVLLLNNQFAVIGLVLTAKSIARFKQLENKDFAERYLIGTLLSLSISLVLTLVLK